MIIFQIRTLESLGEAREYANRNTVNYNKDEDNNLIWMIYGIMIMFHKRNKTWKYFKKNTHFKNKSFLNFIDQVYIRELIGFLL